VPAFLRTVPDGARNVFDDALSYFCHLLRDLVRAFGNVSDLLRDLVGVLGCFSDLLRDLVEIDVLHLLRDLVEIHRLCSLLSGFRIAL
jgi:hypothetical protein